MKGGREILERVKFVEQQVFVAFGPLRLQGARPQVAAQFGELLGQGENHQLEHEVERQPRIVLARFHQLVQNVARGGEEVGHHGLMGKRKRKRHACGDNRANTCQKLGK